jgi:hypothetical protein
VVTFYHRQLPERVAARYLAGDGRQLRHRLLALHFAGQPKRRSPTSTSSPPSAAAASSSIPRRTTESPRRPCRRRKQDFSRRPDAKRRQHAGLKKSPSIRVSGRQAKGGRRFRR